MLLERRVGVYPNLDSLPVQLRSALAQLFPVRFESVGKGCDLGKLDAAIVLAGPHGSSLTSWPPALRRFTFCQGQVLPSNGKTHTVQFSASEAVDRRLRTRTLSHHQQLEPVEAVSLHSADEVLARVDGHPVWVSRGHPSQEIVSLRLPEFGEGERTFDYLNGGSYMRLLPLFHFLRQVTADAWQPPPIRACLMFDDPNLHWRSYGFMNYARLVEQAREGGFHVAMATVPLDAWGGHKEAVRIFKENPGQVSLLIHGNDHTRDEFGRPQSFKEHLGLLAQALTRISGFERTTGLRVGRAMAPPHEACTGAALAAMWALGFEGACISPWSMRHWEVREEWPAGFGLEMAELMPGGFPVVPRFRLSESCEANIVITAFLDLPIIAVGHHQTVARGLDMLARHAAIVGSLGPVRWGSPEMILRSNFALRRDDSILVVKPYSARIRVKVPAGVTALRIVPPTEVAFRVVSPATPHVHTAGQEGIPVRAGEKIEVIAEGLGTVDYRHVPRPAFSWWARPRRLLCETRDRLQPVLYRVRHQLQ